MGFAGRVVNVLRGMAGIARADDGARARRMEALERDLEEGGVEVPVSEEEEVDLIVVGEKAVVGDATGSEGRKVEKTL